VGTGGASSGLLAAPVIDENTSRAVYLPAGEWIDYWSGKHLTGSNVVIADAPLDVPPAICARGRNPPQNS
jgi:alpha-D-xyloside xylohydrolase